MAQEHRKVRGTLLLIASCVAFAGAGSLVRLAADLGASRIALFRFVVGLGLLAAAAVTGKVTLRFHNGRLLLLRGLTGGGAVAIAFFAIAHLGLGKGTLIMSSYPIFACIFSAIFLKERFGLINAVALPAAFAGIYLLSISGSGDALWVLGRYELITIGGAVLSGIAVTVIRKLHETDTSAAIYFSQCAIGMWLVLLPGLGDPAPLGLPQAVLLVAIGVTATIGQLLMTEGYRYLPVRTGSLICMLEPVLAFAAGIMIFSEPFTARSGAGAVLVVGACAMVLTGRTPPDRAAPVIEPAA
ncbi:MAG: DMT family transporter [Phycisphaerae bacterium]|nr:DMT family transporter [Phycisphaerae bacterium]